MLEHVQRGPPDPMFFLKKDADDDQAMEKVDLGVGIYRNEAGQYQELKVVRQAEEHLAQLNLGHDYAPTTGDAEFLRLGAEVLFGKHSKALQLGLISSVQTISGTGANSLGASLIARSFPSKKIYISTPTWANHVPIFQNVGLETVTYPYLDATKHAPNVPVLLDTVRTAPQGSVFVLQGCCHNPTGVDLNLEQWQQLAVEMKAQKHLAFVDIAYQGLGDGLEEDAIGLRALVEAGLEILVCQSFSKNFALYGERCGALHVVAPTRTVAEDVQDKLRSLIRHTYSSSPAYGSRLVKLVLASSSSRSTWVDELESMRTRLKGNREKLLAQLEELQVSGNWDHVLQEKGLFSCLALDADQCRALVKEHHIYVPENGRINIAGLNDVNVKRTARALAVVVRNATQ